MTEPRFHSEARAEFDSSARFYEAERHGLGLSFTAEVERTVQFILSHPNAGAPIWRHFRRVLIRRFPYSVIYHLLDQTVYIVAIAHHHRHPNYWRIRK